MKYRPISSKDSEIRLIKILTAHDAPEHGVGPVHCVSEHVSLNARSSEGMNSASVRTYKGTKGFNSQWVCREFEEIRFQPVARASADTNVLWHKTKSETISPKQLVTTTLSLDSAFITAEADLEWRFAWGDYVALSYVWGDPSITKEIFIDGHSVQVTENLEAALRTLRGSPRISQGFKVWIDAICIDQSNLTERSAQVARMKDIYASARFVVVWLGPASLDSHLAILAVKWLAVRAQARNPLQDFYQQTKTYDYRPLFIKWSRYISPLRRPVYKALLSLFSRPYWRRLWILQEVALGSLDTPVLCGDQCVTWRELHLAALFIQRDEHRFGKELLAATEDRRSLPFEWDFTGDRLAFSHNSRLSSEKLWKLLISITDLQSMQHHSNSQTWAGAHQAFLLGRDAQVTDERDRVYGILGLSSVRALAQILPDYEKTSSQVFYSFSKALLENGHLNALRLVHSPIGEINDAEKHLRRFTPSQWQHLLLPPGSGEILPRCSHGLPSWVICWTCPRGPTANRLGHGSTVSNGAGIATFDSNGQHLSIQCLQMRSIMALSAFHCKERDSRYPWSSDLVRSAYGDLKATKEAFWRTIVAGTVRDSDRAP